MKLLVAAFVSVFMFSQVSFAGPGCDDKDSKMKAAFTQDAKAGTMEVAVKGMACAACVKNLEGKIKAVNVPKGVEITTVVGKITVNYSKAKLDKTQLAKLRTDLTSAISAADFSI